VISAYESGRREPSLSTLERLVAATGHCLVLGLETDPDVRPGLPDTPLGRRLRQRRAALLTTASRHGASNVRVSGSVARGEDTSESDSDLLVDLAPGTGLFSLGTLDLRSPGRSRRRRPVRQPATDGEGEAEAEAIEL
jgi:hypothetical protein